MIRKPNIPGYTPPEARQQRQPQINFFLHEQRLAIRFSGRVLGQKFYDVVGGEGEENSTKDNSIPEKDFGFKSDSATNPIEIAEYLVQGFVTEGEAILIEPDHTVSFTK